MEYATQIDPQHRALLRCTSSMMCRQDLRSCAAVGCYVGIATQDYDYLKVKMNVEVSAHSATSTTLSVASGRLAFTFDLKGPALSIDTACSSSLVAAHLSFISLMKGDVESTLTCGVNLILIERNTIMFQRAGMLAPDGRCKTLDASADGYIRAEGCEIILLAASSDDVMQLNVALGGSAVNQDGRSSSLTAPNGPTQHAVIKSALLDGRFSASDVTSLHLHGTGTSLGDP
ncbi:uncharacterized protein MICPUCDRAFT_13794, partial [Micromonas pusilla CCMP1545]